MFKKITFIVVLALFAAVSTVNAASSYRNRKIDHSSKEEVCKAFTFALLDKDADLIWEMLSPQTRRDIIKAGMSKKEFAENILKKIDLAALAREMGMDQRDAVTFIKALLNDDFEAVWQLLPQKIKNDGIKEEGSEKAARETLRKFLPELRKMLYKEFDELLISQNGKWYIGDSKKVSSSNIPPQRVVRNSTKEEAVESFCIAIAYGDGNMIWELLCPANKKAMREARGETAKAGFVKEFKPDVKFQRMLKNPEEKAVMLKTVRAEIDKDQAWVRANGKWYIDLLK